MSSKRHYIKRAFSYFSRNGFSQTLYKALERLQRDGTEASYVPETADDASLQAQREHVFKDPRRFSILVPVYETNIGLLRIMLESVGQQSYENWELIIADASIDSSRRRTVESFQKKHSFSDQKVRYIRIDDNKGISANTNVALDAASGDYIALLDHDDVLEKTALFDIMSAIEERERAGLSDSCAKVMVAYTDEDKVSEDGTKYFDVHRKPDFDPVLLCTNNYICHLLVIDTHLARSVGGFRPRFDGAQDHDLVLRCTRDLNREEIVHVPKVLYHWRSIAGSTSEDPSSKLYAYEAGKSAVADHLEKCGISAKITDSPHLGFFEIEYESLCEDRESFMISISPDLKALDDKCIDRMLSVMQLPYVGIVTGKIIGVNGRIESAGYDIDRDGGKIPRFSGLNRHFSGYMHGACTDRLVDSCSPDCMVVRKEAVERFDPEIKLKDGYFVYFDPKAVFKRKRI
ncbi:MAG: glycosyltransferase [Lachnospiraceae bacterium]|nr:glycosyltransferase [Lachnospiraceae bacterium]